MQKKMLDLEQRTSDCVMKNNAAILSFLKARDKVICSFVVARGFSGRGIYGKCYSGILGHFKDIVISHRPVSGKFVHEFFKVLTTIFKVYYSMLTYSGSFPTLEWDQKEYGFTAKFLHN